MPRCLGDDGESIAAWGIDYEKVNTGNKLNDKTSTLAI